MKLDANQLAPHLNKTLAPCYLVSGDEHLLVDEALDRIRNAARERDFTSRELHVATTGFDWSQLGVAGANLSLFAERRVIELRLPTGKPGREGSAAIAAFTEKLGDDILLIVSTPKLDRNQSSAKWVKSLSSKGVYVPVWPVDIRELPRWVAGRMRDVGLQPDHAAATVIADRVEGNLLAASQEIEKLRLLLGEGPVTEDDVTNAVADSSRFDVYKLVDAAVAGETRRAIRILRGLQAEGVEPVIVNWALTRELRTLAQLSDHVRRNGDLGAAMQQHRVWRNRMNIVRSCVSRHSLSGLYDLVKAAGRADAAAKGQAAGDPWQMFADIVVDLSQGGRRAA